MQLLVNLVSTAVALVTLGIPLTAAVVVSRDELSDLRRRLGRVLAFDSGRPALDH